MLETFVTIVVALITGAATIMAAMIVARARKHAPNESAPQIVIWPWLSFEQEEPSGLYKIFRVIASFIFGSLATIGLFVIFFPIYLWMGMLGEYSGVVKKLLTIIFLETAALLFCISRWGFNRLKD
jgi:hypothetical protein